jgi:hypothetical protein
LARGLLQDDREWHECLTEFREEVSGWSMRNLFATILDFNSPENPHALWNAFRDGMMEDKLYAAEQVHGRPVPPSMLDGLENNALWEDKMLLRQVGKVLHQFPGMPLAVPPVEAPAVSRAYQAEMTLMDNAAARSGHLET